MVMWPSYLMICFSCWFSARHPSLPPHTLQDPIFTKITDPLDCDPRFQAFLCSQVKKKLRTLPRPYHHYLKEDYADFPQILRIANFSDVYFGYLHQFGGLVAPPLFPKLFFRLMGHHFVRTYMRWQRDYLLRDANRQRKNFNIICKAWPPLSRFHKYK